MYEYSGGVFENGRLCGELGLGLTHLLNTKGEVAGELVIR